MIDQKRGRHILRNSYLKIDSNNTDPQFASAYMGQIKLAISKLIL